jgi:hypothetical protein
MTTAPPTQLDPKMCEWLKELDGKATEEVRLGLKDVLDMSVHCALASGFVIKVLDGEWQRLGGKPGDPVSEKVLKMTNMNDHE